MTRPRLSAALAIAIVLVTSAATFAAGRDPYDGPQWPNIMDDEARWPNIPAEDTIFPTAPAQPPLPETPPKLAPPKTTKASPAVTGSVSSDLAAALGADLTGSTAVQPAQPPESPFTFEAGLRYWYSIGTMRFAFSNGDPLFGNPTSTLDWKDMTGHTGEVFARLDHKPTGMFVKALAGLGANMDGRIEDRDYYVGQLKFSDTTSRVDGDLINFASADVGWDWSPTPGSRLGVFAGYQYWREKATASGLFCNQFSLVTGCPGPGVLVVGYDTSVFVYEPAWHALRLGIEGRIAIDDRWSAHGEVTAIPYAVLRNEDSHLLRQSPADLGPAPNIIAESRTGFGVQTDLFIDYALTPNIEVSAGVRYWELATYGGDVHFGPSFSTNDSLNSFDQQRFGLLLQVKGKF